MARLPENFLDYFYYSLQEDYSARVAGEERSLHEKFLGLTRNNPVMVTCDKAHNPNGAVKSVGYILKDAYLKEAIDAYDAFLNWRWAKVRALMGPGYDGEGWVYSPLSDFRVPLKIDQKTGTHYREHMV
jgi:hypothetical protein